MKSEKPRRTNLGQKIGLGVMAIGFFVPLILIAYTMIRETIGIYCTSECIPSWYFWAGSVLGVPVIMFGAFIFGIAALVNTNQKTSKKK